MGGDPNTFIRSPMMDPRGQGPFDRIADQTGRGNGPSWGSFGGPESSRVASDCRGGHGGRNPDTRIEGMFRRLVQDGDVLADNDQDAQVGLYEWKVSGRPIDEFQMYDRNQDGFITVEEVLRVMAQNKDKPGGGSDSLAMANSPGGGRGFDGMPSRGPGGGPGG